MADLKISQLNAITVLTPATDVLPVVDSGGVTKKITTNQILGSGGTATLASATITGDLTVRTTGLVVNSSGLGVGISPSAWNNTYNAIDIGANGSIAGRTGSNNTIDTASNGFRNSAGDWIYKIATSSPASRYQVDGSSGSHIWFNATSGTSPNIIGWSTLMTLNSTGLGVGGSPNTGLLTVGATTNASATANALTILSQRATFVVTANGATDAAGTTINYAWASGGQGPLIFRNAAISNVLTLDAAGNCGIGVTPSAWNSGYKALELASNVGSWSATTGINDFSLNAFFNASSQWIYKTTAAAVLYRQNAGQHLFFNAPSGTAGNAVTFTQAMTLDASGRLLVGGTGPFGIPNGAGTSFFPLIQTITTSGSAAVSAFVNDGTNNRRIGLFVDNDNGITGISVGRSGGSAPFVYRDATDERLRIDTFGNLITTVPTTPPTLAANSQMVFNLTSNTNLRISVRGTDGVTRTANLTLAP